MERQEQENYERLEQRIQLLEQEVAFLKQQLGASIKSEDPAVIRTGMDSNFLDENRAHKTANETINEAADQATTKTMYEAIDGTTYGTASEKTFGSTHGEPTKGTTQKPPDEKSVPKSSAQVKREEPKESKEPVDWEHLIGRVWLPRIFIFVLLLGLIWGFKVAVDYGVLTEPVRVVLGFGAAIGLYFLGERQIKDARESLGKSLLIGAVGLLILTTFAMNVLYDMLPTAAAFALNVLWIGIGIYLSNRHRSQVMSILMAIVGYLIPFLVAKIEYVPAAVVYEIVFYALLVYYAVHKGFKRLFYVATSLLHVVYFIFILKFIWVTDSDLLSLMALGAVVQHAIIFYSVYRAKFAKMFPIPLLFTSFIITTLWVRLGTLENEHLYVVYLIAASLGYALVVNLKQNRQRKDLLSVGLSIATLGVFLLLLHMFQEEMQVLTATLLIEGVIALYLGCRFRVLFQKISGAFVFLVGTYLTLFTEIYEMVSVATCVWILFLLACYALIYIVKRFYGNKPVQLITLGAIFGHVLFLIYLPQYHAVVSFELLAQWATVLSLLLVYKWTKESYGTNKVLKTVIIGVNGLIHLVLLTDLVQFITEDYSYNITMMSVSFSWALYATISVIVGVLWNKKAIRLLGIALLILTLAKLILVDLYNVTVLIRAILFIGLGGIGMLLSRLLYVKK